MIGAVVAGHGGAVVEESKFRVLLFFVEVAAKVGERGDEAGWELFFEGRLEAPLFGGGGVDELVQIGLQGLQVGFGEDGPAAEVVEVGLGEVTEDEGFGELTVHGGGEFGEFAEAFESSEVVKAGEGAVAVFPRDEGGVVVGEGGESGFGFGVVAGIEAGESGAPAFGFLDIKFGDVGVEKFEGIAALGGVADDQAIGFRDDEEAGVALAGGGNSHDRERRGRGVKGEREGKSEKEEAHERGREGVEGRVALADAPDAFIGFVFGLGFDFEFFVEFLGAFDVRAGDGVLGLFIHARDGVFDEAEGFGFVALFEDNFGGADSSFCGVVDVVFERRGDEGGVGFEGFFEFALFLVGAGELGEDLGAVASERGVGLHVEEDLGGFFPLLFAVVEAALGEHGFLDVFGFVFQVADDFVEGVDGVVKDGGFAAGGEDAGFAHEGERGVIGGAAVEDGVEPFEGEGVGFGFVLVGEVAADLDEDVGGEFFFVEGAKFFEGDLDLGGALGELVFVFVFFEEVDAGHDEPGAEGVVYLGAFGNKVLEFVEKSFGAGDLDGVFGVGTDGFFDAGAVVAAAETDDDFLESVKGFGTAFDFGEGGEGGDDDVGVIGTADVIFHVEIVVLKDGVVLFEGVGDADKLDEDASLGGGVIRTGGGGEFEGFEVGGFGLVVVVEHQVGITAHGDGGVEVDEVGELFLEIAEGVEGFGVIAELEVAGAAIEESEGEKLGGGEVFDEGVEEGARSLPLFELLISGSSEVADVFFEAGVGVGLGVVQEFGDGFTGVVEMEE